MDLQIAQRPYLEAQDFSEWRRSRFHKLVEEWLKSCRGGCDVQARLHAPVDSHDRSELVALHDRFVQSLGHKQTSVGERGELKILGQHAQNPGWPAIKGNGSPDNCRIPSESALPKAIGHQGDLGRVRAVFLPRKVSSEDGLNAEGRQKGGLDRSTGLAQWAIFREVAVIHAGRRRETRERFLVAPPREVVPGEQKLAINNGSEDSD